MNKTPLVCIRCITYNHAPYIEDAMNGFCMQQTTFPYVAVIIDDASTDGEPEVIKAYLDKHFDMQHAHIWENNDAHFMEAQHKENYSYLEGRPFGAIRQNWLLTFRLTRLFCQRRHKTSFA